MQKKEIHVFSKDQGNQKERDLANTRYDYVAHLPDFFLEVHKRYKNKPAFSVVLPQGFKKTMTYDEVLTKAFYVRDYLVHELNLKAGDRVAVSLPNSLAWPVIVIGIILAECVLVNLNPLYQPYELSQVLEDSGARCLFVVDMFAHHVDDFMQNSSKNRLLAVVKVSVAEFMSPIHQGIVKLALRLQGRVRRTHYHSLSFMEVLVRGKFHHLAHLSPVKRLFPGSLLAIRDYTDFEPQLSSETLALLQYTGGTTGMPKGAMLSHGNLLSQIRQLYDRAHNVFRPGLEVCCVPLPLYHIFAFSVNFLFFMSQGAHQVLVPSPRPISNLEPVFRLFPVTWLTGVNTLFSALNHERWFRLNPPKNLRYSIAGGMGLIPEVAVKWKKITGGTIYEGYGLTEASPVCATNLFDAEPILGSIGYPLSECEMKVVRDDGTPCDPQEPGHLYVKGPHVMLGYWNKEEETREVLSSDGWLKTGDIAQVDEKGAYYIVDRAKDLIIVSGFNVYPLEVESVLTEVPGVIDVGVVGVPSTKTGEQVVAFVTVQPDGQLTEERLRAYAAEKLTRYKIPSRIFFVDQLPKTNVGKILRRELREEAKKRLLHS